MIKSSVNTGNYKCLKLVCYVCEGNDHISIDCPEFRTSFEGNIKTYFEKTRNNQRKIAVEPVELQRLQGERKSQMISDRKELA